MHDTAMCGKFCEGGLVHVWWGFVAESGRQTDTCARVLLSFVRVVWYVCGYTFWPNVVVSFIQLY